MMWIDLIRHLENMALSSCAKVAITASMSTVKVEKSPQFLAIAR
jgi:hypothetical protein